MRRLGSGFGSGAWGEGNWRRGGTFREGGYEDVGVENLFHAADEAVRRELKDVDPLVVKGPSCHACDSSSFADDENVAAVGEEVIGAETGIGDQGPALDKELAKALLPGIRTAPRYIWHGGQLEAEVVRDEVEDRSDVAGLKGGVEGLNHTDVAGIRHRTSQRHG
jgi:hypothetical protein